jgi:hypothetical protein
MSLVNDLFPTKFVCDVGTAVVQSQDTLAATLTVGGTTILSETYSPANGQIVVRGLRSVLEAAIYGDLESVSHASAAVVFTIGSNTASKTLYAARLKNPRDPQGTKTTLVAGDIVAVLDMEQFDFLTGKAVYTTTSGIQELAGDVTEDGQSIGDGLHIWVDRTTCPERCVAVRFLNRYDVPQTMMTTQPLDVKPAFQDQTQLYLGNRVRYSVEQQDEYTLRSGVIHSQSEYASWADLVTSRKAEVYYEGQWLPIIVTKSNFTVIRRSMGRPHVEISFRMADPKQGL